MITRIAPGGSDGELSNLDIIFNGTGKTSCSLNDKSSFFPLLFSCWRL